MVRAAAGHPVPWQSILTVAAAGTLALDSEATVEKLAAGVKSKNIDELMRPRTR